MKVLKRVLIPVLCVLVLASAASAGLTRMTKEELRNYLVQKYQPVAGSAIPNPQAFLKGLRASLAPGASPIATPVISTDKQYGATRLTSEMELPLGIGVGELGDYVLINDAFNGDLWAYRDAGLKYVLASPGEYLATGRMYGHYYFGDLAGNIFRLEYDGTVTPLFAFDVYGMFVGSLSVDPPTGLIAFSLDFMSGIEPSGAAPGPGFMAVLLLMNPAEPDIIYLMDEFDDYCFGVAFKGNSLYASLVNDSVILRYTRDGDGPFLFTDKVMVPGDLQVDAKGNVYVSELVTGNVLRFNASATMRKKIAWGFLEPFCLGLDKRGDVFVSDVIAGEVWKLRKKY